MSNRSFLWHSRGREVSLRCGISSATTGVVSAVGAHALTSVLPKQAHVPAGHLRYLLVAANVVMMLRITDEAATLVRTVTSRADRSPQAGLRIIVDPVNHSLSMGIAAAPAPADAVVRRGAAQVFMSPSAAGRLDGRTLRADLSEERSLFFLDG